VDVDQDDIGTGRSGALEGLGRGRGMEHAVAELRDRLDEAFAAERVVIDDEDAFYGHGQPLQEGVGESRWGSPSGVTKAAMGSPPSPGRL